jgi:hypothetical protein
VWIDDIDCPMALRVSAEFTRRAFGVLERLREQLPDWWVEFNLEFGWPPYDDAKLTAMKERKVISVEDLRSCQSPPRIPGTPHYYAVRKKGDTTINPDRTVRGRVRRGAAARPSR